MHHPQPSRVRRSEFGVAWAGIHVPRSEAQFSGKGKMRDAAADQPAASRARLPPSSFGDRVADPQNDLGILNEALPGSGDAG